MPELCRFYGIVTSPTTPRPIFTRCTADRKRCSTLTLSPFFGGASPRGRAASSSSGSPCIANRSELPGTAPSSQSLPAPLNRSSNPLRPRKSAPRRANLSAQSRLTPPGRAIQAPGPQRQPEQVPYSASTSRSALENPGVLYEDMRDLADRIEDMTEQRCAVTDWQASPDVP